MKYLLSTLLAANCLYAVGIALWPAPAQPINAAPPALNVPGLRLLSESARVEVVEPAEASTGANSLASEPLVSADSVPERCLISAPFTDIVDAQRAVDAIEADGAAVELIERQTSSAPTEYLVYIEAPGSRSASKAVCTRLAERGLECHEIPTGARAGALSVGVFSRRVLAQNQLDRVSALGLPTHLVPLGSPQSEFRLMIPAIAAAATPVGVAWSECTSIADAQGLL